MQEHNGQGMAAGEAKNWRECQQDYMCRRFDSGLPQGSSSVGRAMTRKGVLLNFVTPLG